jgi:hypothetical protein
MLKTILFICTLTICHSLTLQATEKEFPIKMPPVDREIEDQLQCVLACNEEEDKGSKEERDCSNGCHSEKQESESLLVIDEQGIRHLLACKNCQ